MRRSWRRLVRVLQPKSNAETQRSAENAEKARARESKDSDELRAVVHESRPFFLCSVFLCVLCAPPRSLRWHLGARSLFKRPKSRRTKPCIHIQHLTRNPARQIAAQKRRSIADFLCRHITPQRRRLFVVGQNFPEAADAGGGQRLDRPC